MNNIKETKKDRCIAWLREYLISNSPVKVCQVIDDGVKMGYSRALIFRAYQVLALHIVNTDGYKSRNNCWVWME